MSQTIKFTDVETNEEIEFEVVEETRVNNVNYLLVTESNVTVDASDDEVAYILKDLSSPEDTEAKYEIVEDDNELEYISKIFAKEMPHLYMLQPQNSDTTFLLCLDFHEKKR